MASPLRPLFIGVAGGTGSGKSTVAANIIKGLPEGTAAIIDHDSTVGWSYRKGAVSIGVIIHGDSMYSGHGPGCQTIMTSAAGRIAPKVTAGANIGRYLKLGIYRTKKR